MCQQGEGVGTAPPKEIVNACNGYYCDNWIEKHARDFPDQPHMFTENWPGQRIALYLKYDTYQYDAFKEGKKSYLSKL